MQPMQRAEVSSADPGGIALQTRRVLLGLVAFLLSLTATSTARAGYQITDLGILGGGMSQGAAISDAGLATGTSSFGSGVSQAFLYNPTTGQVASLGGVSGGSSYGKAINAGGVVVGGGVVANGQTFALKFFQGQATQLQSVPGWVGSGATGINDLGQIVGTATLASGVTHAFLVNAAGKTTDLGTFGAYSTQATGINESGVIVGSISYSTGVTHAFRVSLGGAIQDLGGLSGANNSSYGLAINNQGEVVGYGGSLLNPTAFRTLADGTLQNLGTLPGASSGVANAVNDYGQIVGAATYNSGGTSVSEAFYFSDRTGMIDLTQSLVNGQGWDITSATGINNYGQITGTAVYNGQTHAYLLTPVLSAVPEPSSVWLIGLGLVCGFGVQARFRRGRTGDREVDAPADAFPGR